MILCELRSQQQSRADGALDNIYNFGAVELFRGLLKD